MNSITLNREQQQAVNFGSFDNSANFVSSPLLIIAGAGTGKTNTLAHRAAHLLLNKVDPERILLMTFSRRAATELSDRTKKIVIETQKASGKPVAHFNLSWMGTFHSIANRLLRRYGQTMGIDPNFTIIDRNDSADFIDVLRHELRLTSRDKRFPKKSTCLNIYSRCVNSQLKISEVLKQEFPWCEEWENELTSLFKLYSQKKLEQLSLDYDDLLLYWFYMVDEPEIAKLIGQNFDHVLVDEYQDTNLLQAGILARLFPDGNGLTVVGDDAQSIYSFRSAEIENILNFPHQFSPAAKVISLKINYRSTQPILDLANELLSQSKIGYDKKLVSHQIKKYSSTTDKPKIVTVEDDVQQAKYIVETVLSERENGIDYNFIYFMLWSFVFYLGLTIFSVPYVAMGYEMSDDFHERTSIMAIAQWIGQWAWVIAPWFWVIMYDPEWFPSADVAVRELAVWVAIPCAICAIVPAIFIIS